MASNETNSATQSLISIIVPIYNTEAYLDKCIGSILRQTYARFELLLVDDGSTDRSGAICDQYAARDQRIKVFHKPNGGSSSARNVGLENSRGEFLAYIDSDDWVDEDYLEKLLEPFRAEGGNEIDIVVGFNRLSLKTGRITKVEALSGIFMHDVGDLTLYMKLYRRKLFEGFKHHEGYTVGEDGLDNWMLFDRAEHFYRIALKGYNYTVRPDSYCQNKNEPMRFVSGARSLTAILHDALERNVDRVIVDALLAHWVNVYTYSIRSLVIDGAKHRDALAALYAIANADILEAIARIENEFLRDQLTEMLSNGVDGIYRYYDERFDELRSIVEGGGKVYIYGARDMAAFMTATLNQNGIRCEAYVVSAGQPTKISADVPSIELPVKNIDRLERSNRNAIVMGVGFDVLKIVVPPLLADGIEKIFIL